MADGRRVAVDDDDNSVGGHGDDESAVAAALAGDQRAFDVLYRRHAVAVRRAVAERERDGDQQLDLVQETFLRAFARLGDLREPARFRPWLLQTARNVATDHQRRRARQPTETLDRDQDVESAAPTSEEMAELHDLAGRMQRGMAALTVRDATALTLTVQLGLGPAELAVALGITPNHAKVVLHRARRRLKAALALELDGLGTSDGTSAGTSAAEASPGPD